MTVNDNNNNNSLYPSLSQFDQQQQQQQQQPVEQQQTGPTIVVYKSGWLQKKGDGVVQSWKKRFFVVDNESIKYFTDESGKVKKGAIEWDSILSIDFTKFKMSSDTRYFQIATSKSNGRVYYLFAEDQLIALEWVNNLKVLLSQYEIQKKQFEESQELLRQQKEQQDKNDINTYLNEQEQQNQEQQQQQQQFDYPTNPYSYNSESQYKDFLNYTTPYFSHYTSIMSDNAGAGSPMSSTMLGGNTADSKQLIPPPRPPGTLRTLSLEEFKRIVPVEGADIDIYYQSTVYFSNILLTSGDDFALLSAYLVLSILDWDNKKSQPLPYPSTPPYESDIVFPYFAYALQLSRSEVLNRWKSEGPAYCTQIDNFAKKKRKNYTLLLENEDRETFLNRNLLLLSHIHRDLLSNTRAGMLEDAILVLIDRFLENTEVVPATKFANSLVKESEAAALQHAAAISQGDQSQIAHMVPPLSDADRALFKDFIYAYLTFQKLHLERKNVKIPFENSLQSLVDNLSHLFSGALHKHPLMAPYQSHIQKSMFRIFFLWQKDLPLCESTCTHEIAMYRYFKVFSRMQANLNESHFPQLYKSVSDIKLILFEYIKPAIGTFDLNNVDSSPLDSILTL